NRNIDDMDHMDMGHKDMGHMDMQHKDMGHMDMGHKDMGHMDMQHKDMGHMDMGAMGHGDMDMSGMQTHFTFDIGFRILAEALLVDDLKKFIGVCFLFGMFGFIYEMSKSVGLTLSLKQNSNHKRKFHARLSLHALQTLLFISQMSLAYLLMMAIMTYNVFLVLSVILGSGLGYFTHRISGNAIQHRNERRRSVMDTKRQSLLIVYDKDGRARCHSDHEIEEYEYVTSL
ncbi:unnamed protein product, partial [Owenia fusiformis]